MRLGELLIQEKLITPQALEEAMEAQVVHGGRLGTNLLELGFLSEKDLARMLGQLHGCAHSAGVMKPDAQALELVDLNEADDKDYLPMRVDATRLSLAVINPRDYTTLDAVAFKTGKRVVPVVIPEFRMHQLLRRYCKAFRPLRAIDMNAVRPPKAAQEEAAGVQARAAKSAELISEEEFQSVYAQALTGGSRSELIDELLEEQEEVITGEELAVEEEEEVITGEVMEEEPAPEETHVPGPAAPRERPTLPMWSVPVVPSVTPRAGPAAGSPPVPDDALPSANPPAPFRPMPSGPPALEPVPQIPFIPAPAEPPVRRSGTVFVPLPSDETPARPGPLPGSLPPVAPIVPPMAPPARTPAAPPPMAAKPAAPGKPVAVPGVPGKLAAAPGKALPRRPATARPEAPKPFTFAEAQAQLTQSSDREDVATTVLRYAVGKWRRCLLLSVQGSLVTGWHGMGRGVRDAAVRRIGVALREGNTFRLVRDTRSHYVGPVKRDTAMNVFYRLLGADKRPEPPFPKTSVILPLLVRGKVVHLLYLDNGPDQLTTPDVGELMILAQSVGRSYEEMIRRRKSA
jgi:Type II secretion system (T2SS), protein E, N-terminal domain